MEITVLTGADVARLVPMRDAIDAMRTAFTQLSGGGAELPLRTHLGSPLGTTLFMPGRLTDPPVLGGKVVSVFPGNAPLGLGTIQALVLLIDTRTGRPSAVLDGTRLTALRTGAASGLATELLALPEAQTLAVFGAGAQARTQVDAVLAVRPIREVRVVSRGGASARALVTELGDRVDARAVDDPVEAVSGAHVVVTATDSRSPVFPGYAVGPGCHVNGVGSFTPEMQEVDAVLVERARVFVDARDAAWAEAGDLIVPEREGRITRDHVLAELGEVVAGTHPGRAAPEDVTFFKSVGSAAQDLAVARLALERAREQGAGTAVEM